MASSETLQDYPPAYLQAYIGNRSINVAISFIVIEVIVVAARFYAKTKISASLATDDFLIIPALVRSVDGYSTGADVGRHVGWASVQSPSRVSPLQPLLNCQQY